MEKFRWLLTSEVAGTIDRLSKRERARLFLAFEQIAAFPFVCGYEVGGHGRKQPAFQNLFGRWTVVWWVDFPVKEEEANRDPKPGYGKISVPIPALLKTSTSKA